MRAPLKTQASVSERRCWTNKSERAGKRLEGGCFMQAAASAGRAESGGVERKGKETKGEGRVEKERREGKRSQAERSEVG